MKPSQEWMTTFGIGTQANGSSTLESGTLNNWVVNKSNIGQNNHEQLTRTMIKKHATILK